LLYGNDRRRPYVPGSHRPAAHFAAAVGKTVIRMVNQSTFSLTITNIALGIGVVAALMTVAAGVFRDVLRNSNRLAAVGPNTPLANRGNVVYRVFRLTLAYPEAEPSGGSARWTEVDGYERPRTAAATNVGGIRRGSPVPPA